MGSGGEGDGEGGGGHRNQSDHGSKGGQGMRGAGTDLHQVAGIPVQLSKDDTLGRRERDPYLQQHHMHMSTG